MKYIVCMIDGKECLFVFPKMISHDFFAEGMEAIRFGDHRNWERKLYDGDVISAGFVTNGRCHGRSETLNLDSRGEKDTALFAEAFGKS